MHRVLLRQLRKFNLSETSPPDASAWQGFLAHVDATYAQEEKQRYLLERSLRLTSDEMRDLYERLRNSYEARLRAILNALPDLIFLVDEEYRFVEVMAADESRLAVPKAEILGRRVDEVLQGEQSERIMAAIAEVFGSGRMRVLEYDLRVPAGLMRFEARILRADIDSDDRASVICLARDITELHHSREKLVHAAYHDELTGLPNRRMFCERLAQSIAHNQRMGRTGAVYFMDMDRFKYINDTLGHATGDALLRQVASRLVLTCRKEDTLARFGGDEFAILIEEIGGEAAAEALAAKLQAACAEPFQLPGLDFSTSASIGGVLFPAHGVSVEEVLRHADVAMYDAKHDGPGRHHFYSPELERGTSETFSLEADLRLAMARDELFMVYQPRVTLPAAELAGFEALIRWRHPTRGLVPPDVFIPLAENTGMMDEIGLWVFRAVCRQIAAWRARGLDVGCVSFNLSRRQLSDPYLVWLLSGILAETGVDAAGLECEVTESAIIQQTDVALDNLRAIAALGMPLAIDDFGTGHSSLINLKRYPLNRIKIDRAFVREVGKDANDEAIIRAILAMASSMGMAVTAEGVETRAQAEFLVASGCQEAQGYLYSQPLEVAAAEALLSGGAIMAPA